MTARTLICFPVVVGFLSGCTALEVGARYVWVHLSTGERVKLLRSAFTSDDFDTSKNNGNDLAFKARRLALPGV